MTNGGDDGKTAAEEAARVYAWNWFQYHAGQRQAVFRFYLILVGVVSAGYLAAIKSSDLQSNSYFFGALITVLSFLFWRLDVRSQKLIKLAESYLKIEEARLKGILGAPEIQLAIKADLKEERYTRFPIKYVYSFKQVYRVIFLIAGAIGLFIFFFDSHSPIRCWLT